MVLVENITDELYKTKFSEVEKFKLKLLASISHELQTPLNSSINMLQLSKAVIKDPAILENYILPPLCSNKLLLSIVQDILDFARIETGDFDLKLESFNLQKSVLQCLKLFSAQLKIKHLDCRFINKMSIPKIHIISDLQRFK